MRRKGEMKVQTGGGRRTETESSAKMCRDMVRKEEYTLNTQRLVYGKETNIESEFSFSSQRQSHVVETDIILK